MSKRRVVVTGIGLVSPLGCGAEAVCSRLLAGSSGIARIRPELNVSLLCNVNAVATIPQGSHEWNSEYGSDIAFGKSKHTSKFIEFAQLATDLSLRNAGIGAVKDIVDVTRAGVAIGNGGIGSLTDINESNGNLTQSFKKLSPYFVPKVLVNMAAGQVSIKHGLQGPVHSVATACAAGAHSIGDAFNFIRLGYADVMLAGGTDASVDPLALAGFARMKALGRIDGPEGDSDEGVKKTSRPFHPQRNGFVMGEGAGVLVLEELSVAQQRGARILAEVCGYGLSGDAFNSTAPCEDGDGAMRSMRMALRDAGVAASEVGYINAHATSTPAGDAAEVTAVRRLFAQDSDQTGTYTKDPARKAPLFVSSTKGATGHLLGAAGAVETIFTIWALHTGIVPPTLNLDVVDPALEGGEVFSHVPQQAVDYKVASGGQELRYALKNSFGFGGTNASLLLAQYQP